jgi:hypothetical protein
MAVRLSGGGTTGATCGKRSRRGRAGPEGRRRSQTELDDVGGG